MISAHLGVDHGINRSALEGFVRAAVAAAMSSSDNSLDFHEGSVEISFPDLCNDESMLAWAISDEHETIIRIHTLSKDVYKADLAARCMAIKIGIDAAVNCEAFTPLITADLYPRSEDVDAILSGEEAEPVVSASSAVFY